MSPQLNFKKEDFFLLVCFVYCHHLNSAWLIVGAKRFLLNDEWIYENTSERSGSWCILIIWPVEVIDEFFNHLGSATTLIQGSVHSGCLKNVCGWPRDQFGGGSWHRSWELPKAQIGFSSMYDLVLGAKQKKKKVVSTFINL